MKVFKIKSLDEWHPIVQGEIIQFEPGKSGRALHMEFNVSDKTRVMASHVADMTGAVMLAASDGQFTVQVSHEDTLYISVKAEDLDASVYLKTRDHSHVVAAVSTDKITEIAPRRTRNPELDYMMAVMRHNEEQRDRKFAAEVARIRAEQKDGDARVIEPVRKAPPEPEDEQKADDAADQS